MMRVVILALSFTCLLPLQCLAEAPVVDDSENFAILDEQQAALQQPVAKAQLDNGDTEEEEIALARDNGISNTDADLVDKLQSMQKEIRELRGQLEVQSHDLQLLQQQQLAFYKDIDTRLHNAPVKLAEVKPDTPLSVGSKATPALPATASNDHLTITPASIPAPTIPSAHSNLANEQIGYLGAYDLVKNKRYDDALIAMQNFVTRYPAGGYTANAQYWLGELYMVKKNHPEAIKHFEIVLKQFPGSSKAAACSLKIGYALAASGNKTEATLRLQQVLKNYPDTPTAQLAAIKLKTINAS